MPTLKADFVVRPSAPFGLSSAVSAGSGAPTNSIKERVRTFRQAEKRAAAEAAQIATRTSRASFHYLRPPAGAQRPGRESTGGRFPDYLEWEVDPRSGQVELALQELETRAPHWIILEIGTGERAQMRVGGDTDGAGGSIGPRARLRTIPTQRGRRIHPSLVFADGPGGKYSPPGAERGQQLFARSRVIGAPRRRLGIVIKREIEGQHFVQKGAEAGFRHYRQSVLAAARNAFQKGSAT